MTAASRYSAFIKQQAAALGFDYCGIARAEFLADEAPRLEAWLKKKAHGEMSYMERNFDKRLDPRILVPGAKSMVSLMLNYYPEERQRPDAPQISKYAYGVDYHTVIKDKLYQLFTAIQREIGDVQGRVFVDSAPVMDKVWAQRAGLGWMGKHTNLIHPKKGSFFFIAELIIDLELAYDGPIKDYCGTCTRCIDACPTDAIVAPYEVDGSKCISYLTIELKNNIPTDFAGQMENWMFGCDICQDVCPWNRFSKPHQEPLFQAKPELLNMTTNDWQELTEELFKKLFKDSAISRTKYQGLMRNLNFITIDPTNKNAQHEKS